MLRLLKMAFKGVYVSKILRGSAPYIPAWMSRAFGARCDTFINRLQDYDDDAERNIQESHTNGESESVKIEMSNDKPAFYEWQIVDDEMPDLSTASTMRDGFAGETD